MEAGGDEHQDRQGRFEKYLVKDMPGRHDQASGVRTEGGLHRVSWGQSCERFDGNEDSFCRRAKSKKFYLCAAKLERQAQGEAQTSEQLYLPRRSPSSHWRWPVLPACPLSAACASLPVDDETIMVVVALAGQRRWNWLGRKKTIYIRAKRGNVFQAPAAVALLRPAHARPSIFVPITHFW